MTHALLRARLEAARVAHLATVRPDGAPHIVPITFALDGDTIYTPIDHKPKRTQRLQRLINIADDPRVAVLADAYDEDWSALWWVRVDGVARVLEPRSAPHFRAADVLAVKYQQYRRQPPSGPIIAVAAEHWTSWSSR